MRKAVLSVCLVRICDGQIECAELLRIGGRLSPFYTHLMPTLLAHAKGSTEC